MRTLLALALATMAAHASAMDLAGAAKEAAIRHGLEPRLVNALILVESGWNPKAISPKGALGLMQLMPATARALGVRDPLDPDDNLDGGCRYLSQMLDRFGDVRLALAAYNAGPEVVSRTGDVPHYAETVEYVERILRAVGASSDAHPSLRLALRTQRPQTLVVDLAPSGAGIVLLLGGDR